MVNQAQLFVLVYIKCSVGTNNFYLFLPGGIGGFFKTSFENPNDCFIKFKGHVKNMIVKNHNSILTLIKGRHLNFLLFYSEQCETSFIRFNYQFGRSKFRRWFLLAYKTALLLSKLFPVFQKRYYAVVKI